MTWLRTRAADFGREPGRDAKCPQESHEESSAEVQSEARPSRWPEGNFPTTADKGMARKVEPNAQTRQVYSLLRQEGAGSFSSATGVPGGAQYFGHRRRLRLRAAGCCVGNVSVEGVYEVGEGRTSCGTAGEGSDILPTFQTSSWTSLSSNGS